MGFPDDAVLKNPPISAGDVGLIPVRESPWSGKWQPAPVFLPGKLHGKRNPAGYSPWGHIKSDMTERLSTHTHIDPNGKLLAHQNMY